MNDYILVVCLNPTLQKTIVLKDFRENEVNRSDEHRLDAAGKGVNTARVLYQLGLPVRHLTQAGGWNRELYLSLAEDGFPVDWVESGAEVRYCYTLIDRSKTHVTEIVEEGRKVEPGTGERVLGKYLELLGNARGVVISGSKAAGFPDGLFPDMTSLAGKAGIPIVLDYRGKDLLRSLPSGPDIVKPNYEEFVSTFFPGDDGTVSEAAVRAKMLDVAREYGCAVVVTRGSKGVLYTDGGEVKTRAITPVAPVNTTGSGDAFTAGFFASWLQNRDLAKAVAKGAECGRLNALLLKPGAIRE